jgi:heme exporter protein A
MVLTGPNGSGKTTLLRCISRLFPDYEGQIETTSLEYLGHRPGVALMLTPLENLRWYASLNRRAGQAGPIEADLLKLLERVGLAGFEEVPAQQLSAGQQRRVALARLEIGRGRLWLLDEPFTALDSSGQDLVRSLIEEHLEAGGAVLSATHQPLGLLRSLELRLGPTLGDGS